MAVVARAINKQLKRDVAPVWDVVVSVTNSTSPGVQCDATMIITDELPEGDGYLGYHDRDENGLPYGYVFRKVSEQYGENWTVTLSHEVLEMLMDPFANITARTTIRKKLAWVWYELSDPVQADTYTIDGVEVSDFVLPGYFMPGIGGSFLTPDLKPFSVRPGGYLGYETPDGEVEYIHGGKAATQRLQIKSKYGIGRGANLRRLDS